MFFRSQFRINNVQISQSRNIAQIAISSLIRSVNWYETPSADATTKPWSARFRITNFVYSKKKVDTDGADIRASILPTKIAGTSVDTWRWALSYPENCIFQLNIFRSFPNQHLGKVDAPQHPQQIVQVFISRCLTIGMASIKKSSPAFGAT